MIRVRPAAGFRDRDRFIKLPFRLYRDDPRWVPPLLVAERERLNPQKNPFFQHADHQLFLAERDGKVIGRIAAIDDRLHREVHREAVGFFGFFEAADSEVAKALLREAEDWARQRGLVALRGPANPSLNDSAGFQVDAFGSRPYVMMPYSPPEYLAYVEAAGYRKVKDLFCWLFDICEGVGQRNSRLIRGILRRVPLQVRMLDMKRFKQEVDTIRGIYCAAWAENWGFVPPTRAEFDHLAASLKMVIDPDFALMVEVDGVVVAFAITLPDLHQVFSRMNGRLFPTGIIKLLRRRRYIDQLRMALLGVLPNYRGKGLEYVLIAESIERAQRKGYRFGECSWTLEDNSAISRTIGAIGARHYKTYRLYERPLL